MWTRNILIVACCLIPTSVPAAPWVGPDNAEVIPAPNAVPQVQHYAYLPPLPGWYSFRPYSVGQLCAQQKAVMEWGGDPRNPYAGLSDNAPPNPDVLNWPPVLRDERFKDSRAKIEAPYRHSPKGKADPTITEYQNMIDSAGQMKTTLARMATEISAEDRLDAEEFLDRLTAGARRYRVAQVQVQQKAVLEARGRDSHFNGASQPQLVQQRAASATSLPGTVGAVHATSFQSTESATEIIDWPPALRNPQFTTQRARIEAPYHRNPKRQARLTAADFQKIVVVASQMKADLNRMTVETSAQDRLNAEKFLNQLITEARGQMNLNRVATEQPLQ